MSIDSDAKIHDGERGSLLLQAVLLVALMAISAGSVMPVLGAALRERMNEETLVKMRRIESALHAYYRDLEALPGSLASLMIEPSGATGWRGPYITQLSTDVSEANLSYDIDAWRQPLVLVVIDSWNVRILSFGENRVDDGGGGDDLVIDCSLHGDAWEVTRRELSDIDAALAAYNQNVVPSTLPGSWPELLYGLQDAGYLPNQEPYTLRLLQDGWGQSYVPDTAPPTTVTTLGPPTP